MKWSLLLCLTLASLPGAAVPGVGEAAPEFTVQLPLASPARSISSR